MDTIQGITKILNFAVLKAKIIKERKSKRK